MPSTAAVAEVIYAMLPATTFSFIIIIKLIILINFSSLTPVLMLHAFFSFSRLAINCPRHGKLKIDKSYILRQLYHDVIMSQYHHLACAGGPTTVEIWFRSLAALGHGPRVFILLGPRVHPAPPLDTKASKVEPSNHSTLPKVKTLYHERESSWLLRKCPRGRYQDPNQGAAPEVGMNVT